MTGIVSLEDLLEELVGEIADEYDREEPEVSSSATACTGSPGKASIDDVNEELGGRAAGRGVGHGRRSDPRPPRPGARGRRGGHVPRSEPRADKVQGRRIASVLIARCSSDEGQEPEVGHMRSIEMDDRIDKSGGPLARSGRAYVPYSGFHVGAALLAGELDPGRP